MESSSSPAVAAAGWAASGSVASAAELRTPAESPCADAVAQIAEQVGVLLGARWRRSPRLISPWRSRPRRATPGGCTSTSSTNAPTPLPAPALARADGRELRRARRRGRGRDRDVRARARRRGGSGDHRRADCARAGATAGRRPAACRHGRGHRTAPSAPQRIAPSSRWRRSPGLARSLVQALGLQLDVGPDLVHQARRARHAVRVSGERLADDTGGDFLLTFGALLACASQAIGKPTLLGCVGFELGRLSGEGVGVRPRLGTVTWLAPTTEVGIQLPLTPKLAVVRARRRCGPFAAPRFCHRAHGSHPPPGEHRRTRSVGPGVGVLARRLFRTDFAPGGDITRGAVS